MIAAPDRRAGEDWRTDDPPSRDAETGDDSGGPCVAAPRVMADPDAPVGPFGTGAHIAYDAWRAHLGGVLPTGHELPELEELSPHVADAWDQAGAAFLHAVSMTVTDAVQDGAADAVGEAFAHTIHHTRMPAAAVGGVVLVPLRELNSARRARVGGTRW